jgi:hypothetical protein
MIYGGTGFHAVFASAPRPPHPRSPARKLDQTHTGRLRKRGNFLTGEGEGGGGGAQSYDREKAWSSINHSLLSVGSYDH